MKNTRAKSRPANANHGEALLGAILESAAQAILTVDAGGVIRSVNPKTCEIFDYAKEELLGQAVEILLPESARNVHVKHRESYFAEPRTRPMGVGLDLQGRRKNGEEFPVEISLSHVRTQEGVFGIAFVSDIAGRKTLEEQLLQSQKIEAVGKLAGGIAHDFNNLLTIISGFNGMLLERISPLDPLRGCAEEIHKASERAAALVQQLLAFSRRQVIRPQPINLNELINEISRMLRLVIGERIDLQLILRQELDPIRADRGQIEQVLMNLTVNARDAMPEGGRLIIETANVELGEDYVRTHLGVAPGQYVMLAVSDEGAGMDAETRRHIFEPFFTTKPAAKGTGLGLATVYGIVKQNRGDIWLYSEPGKGTTFKVYLPSARGERTAGTAKAASAPSAGGGSETILVVEDEDGVRLLMAEILTAKGYEVHTAANALEALRFSKEFDRPIDLLLTDVVLPQRSGHEVAREIRAGRPAIKVVYVSGYTENMVHSHGVVKPGTHFLQKPFNFEALLKLIRAALES